MKENDNKKEFAYVIICRRVKFYSQDDQDAFFTWLHNISCVSNVKGVSDTLHITINNSFNDDDLCRLVALFRRYKISCKLLLSLVNDENKELFESCQGGFSILVYPTQQSNGHGK